MEIHERPSPHQSSRRGANVDLIVVHGDAGHTDEGTISWIMNPASKVSYHYLVGRDGRIYRFVPDHKKAWHAGRSAWPPNSGENSVNARSLGVSFANNGDGEAYRDEQYVSGGQLIADLMGKYDISLPHIRGHYEVSPGRKTDPWSYFDWHALFGWVGMFAGGKP